MEQSVTDSVEASVGISVFLSPGEPIKCLFKQRFSDFVVNEVTPERELVFLSDPHLWKDFSSVKESH
jgi:tRNA pseudouridine13 synthase